MTMVIRPRLQPRGVPYQPCHSALPSHPFMKRISDKKPVRDFIALCQANGIRHIVIAPGSRNAPFSTSFFELEGFDVYSIVDERSAGFFALGIGQQTGHPPVVICTSGTAALNLAPAIAEAYYQRVPMVVVTADRPHEWIDQGEGQSIRQHRVFANFTKFSCEVFGEDSSGDGAWYNARLMDEAMRTAMEGVQGPVHINFPLRESLYSSNTEPLAPVKRVVQSPTQRTLTRTESAWIGERLSASPRVMVLAGQLFPDAELQASLVRFAAHSQVVVMTEAHSNLAHPSFITTIDRLLLPMDKASRSALVPDLLITIGHNIISRKIKDMLRAVALEHWHIDLSGEGLDTLKNLARIIPMKPAEFFSSVSLPETTAAPDAYAARLKAWNAGAREAGDAYLQRAAFSDLQVFHTLLQAVPAGYHLQMGNSSVVRYILLSDAREDLRYFGNRGVAGIDGCTSTAVGAVAVSGKPTLLISGDIAFFYDVNAFWNDHLSHRLRIVVVNNGGGGIFRIIDGPSTTPALERHFETTHQRSASGVAAMYGIPYRKADDAGSLAEGLHWLFAAEQCSILEVFTPRLENAGELNRFFSAIGQSVFNT